MWVARRNVLDGALLWRFAGLDTRDQHRLARAVGTTAARVLSALRGIDGASRVFARVP